MSISISIGAMPQDIENLQKTKDIISFVYNLLKSEDQEIIFSQNTYTREQINDLLSWYNKILEILYNGGNIQDIQLKPNLV